MRRRSKKRESEYAERRRIVALMTGGPCPVCRLVAIHKHDTHFTQREATDVHELVNRSQGGSILDPDNLLAVCRTCHSWITTHPKEAHEMGVSLKSYENNITGFSVARKRRENYGMFPRLEKV